MDGTLTDTTRQRIGLFRCPHGQPGDRLWVKETFCPSVNVNNLEDWPGCPHLHISDIPPDVQCGYAFDAIIYAATVSHDWTWCDEDGGFTDRSFWKPSIFMPRWASRITLEIVSVRVERLQEIKTNDCYEEGIKRPIGPFWGTEVTARDNAVGAYWKLWDSINAKTHPWSSNPFVWVIEFRRLKP
jgi:hypothetical protein